MRKIIFILLLLAGISARSQIGTAVRELPFDFHPGDLVDVRIQVTPPPGTTNWMVSEMYPNGWDFVSATNASSMNEFTSTLTFGPFTDALPRTLAYEVASIMGLTDSVDFVGQVTFNNVSKPVAGTTHLPARNEWLFEGPQSLGEADFVAGIAYGAGRWLASSLGWTTTLEPGGRLTYPRGLHPYGLGFSRLAYAGGLFLLFGAGPNGAQLMISDDGLVWKTAQDEAGDANNFQMNPQFDPFAESGGFIQAVAYGNGVYLAVGEHYYSATEPHWAGAVFRSTNGYNWKRVFRLPTPDSQINAVAFANGRFMAAASRDTLLTSTNGLDWTVSQPTTSDNFLANRDLLGICYGPAGWIIPASVLASDTQLGTVLQSVDGETWNEFTGTGSGNNLYWQSFYADGKYWFSGYTESYTTVSGNPWMHPGSPLLFSNPGGPVSRAPDGINPQYLAAGMNLGSLVTSTNGNDWNIEVPGASAVWPRYLSVASFSNEWVVSSQPMNGDLSQGAGRYFPNDRPGKIWLPQLTGAGLNIRGSDSQWRKGDTDKSYADLLGTTNGILAAGADTHHRLFSSFLTGTTYAFTPTAAVLPALQRNVAGENYKGNAGWEGVNACLIKVPNGYDLYAELYSAGGPPQITWGHFCSTNGNNWKLRPEGLNNVTNFPGIRGLAWGAGVFIAVSEGSSPGPSDPFTSTSRIYISTNGEHYVALDLSALTPGLNSEGLTGIAYGGGKFVAIGNAGSIISSTNGLDWITAHASDGHRWNRVRYLDGGWAAVGNAGWVGFSADGQNWTNKTSGTESDLTDVAKQNGSFMAVGSHAMVLVSLPAAPLILADTLVKLPGSGLQFSVSGQTGKILDIQTSSNLVDWTSLLTTNNTTGTAVIIDPQPNQAMRFYRAVQQP